MRAAKPVSKPTPQRERARREYEQIPRRSKETADPATYSKTPHDYGDILIQGGKLGGPLQRDIIYWIERYTWGANVGTKEDVKRPEYAKLSITKLAQLCRWWDSDQKKLRPAERKNVAVQVADLEKRGIIGARDRKGCGPTVGKMYKLTPETWKEAPPYSPPTRKEIEAAEAIIEAEDEAEAQAAAPDATVESIVPNGRPSRPATLAVRPTPKAEPVTIRLVYNPSGFDFPLTIQARTGQNGRIQLNLRPHKTGEKKANDYGCAQPQFEKSDVANKRFIEFDDAINAISQNAWGIALEDALISRIVEAAGPAPVEVFARIAQQKFCNREAARKHAPGLLVKLAEQAARSHAKQQAIEARQRAAAPAASNPPPPAPEEIEAAEARERQWEENQRAQAEAEKRKCYGCKGAGKIASGIKGVMRQCGICKGSGERKT